MIDFALQLTLTTCMQVHIPLGTSLAVNELHLPFFMETSLGKKERILLEFLSGAVFA